MSEVIDLWRKARASATAARQHERKMEDWAEENAKIPENLRPATSKDITEGQIIWYKKGEYNDFDYWKEVGEVLRPSDDFKGYCAHDGCRYGLDRAFVEESE